MIINYELWRTWNPEKIKLQNFPEEIHGDRPHDDLSPCRDSNLGPWEYKAVALTIKRLVYDATNAKQTLVPACSCSQKYHDESRTFVYSTRHHKKSKAIHTPWRRKRECRLGSTHFYLSALNGLSGRHNPRKEPPLPKEVGSARDGEKILRPCRVSNPGCVTRSQQLYCLN